MFKQFLLVLPLTANSFPSSPMSSPLFPGGRLASELQDEINQEMERRYRSEGISDDDIEDLGRGVTFSWFDPARINPTKLGQFTVLFVSLHGVSSFAAFSQSDLCTWAKERLFPTMARVVGRERHNLRLHHSHELDTSSMDSFWAQLNRSTLAAARITPVKSEKEFVSALLVIADMAMGIAAGLTKGGLE
jgi:hypothetical protein